MALTSIFTIGVSFLIVLPVLALVAYFMCRSIQRIRTISTRGWPEEMSSFNKFTRNRKNYNSTGSSDSGLPASGTFRPVCHSSCPECHCPGDGSCGHETDLCESSLDLSSDTSSVKFYLPSDDGDDISGHWTKQQYMPHYYEPYEPQKPKIILSL